MEAHADSTIHRYHLLPNTRYDDLEPEYLSELSHFDARLSVKVFHVLWDATQYMSLPSVVATLAQLHAMLATAGFDKMLRLRPTPSLSLSTDGGSTPIERGAVWRPRRCVYETVDH